MGNDLIFEKNGAVSKITLNRPGQLNAFTPEMIDNWVLALEESQRDDTIRVIIVTGAGRAFCSGGDIKKMGERQDASALDRKNTLWKHIHRVPLLLYEQIDKPVIASLNGLAAGAGLDMALMCDLRIAAQSARFAETYANVGIVPGDGGAYFLPRLVGIAKALEMFWTREWVTAEEALRIGLVNRVVPDEDLESETMALAEKIAGAAPLAITLTKRAVYQGMSVDLRTHLDTISSHMVVTNLSKDHREAVQAFIEKRKPVFTGE